MKHIFKKLQKSHQNQTLASSPQPSSDHGPSQSATAEVPAASPTSGVGNTVDYLSSEEEFQMQLALAISASNSDLLRDHDPENDQIRAATLLSLESSDSVDGFRNDLASAEALSRRYWEFGVLDFGEKVVDGFYDVYSVTMVPTIQSKMPSLAKLVMSPGDSGFEAVIVNRTIDPVLQELEQVVHCIAIDCPPSSIGLFVQRLAELVTDHMGGRAGDASIMLARWLNRSAELRTSLRTSVFPIGSLKPGISRHRALLFKVLADKFGIGCRLMKGNHNTGIGNDVVNIIKLDERDFLVDLMAAPGTLIPADVLNTKHSSSQSGNQMLNKVPYQQLFNDCSVMIPHTKEMLSNDAGISRAGISRDAAENMRQFHPNLCSGQSQTSSLGVKNEAGAGPGPSRYSCKSSYPKELDFPSTSVVGSSLCKANRGALTVGDGIRMNVNVPYNQDNVDLTTNPFADLNPFHMRGGGRLVQNKPRIYKVDESHQRQRNDPVSGRPPFPKMWKNHHAINEAPRKMEYDIVQGVFPRNCRDTNDFNMSAASSSSVSENIISKTTDEPSLTCIYKDAGNFKNDVALEAAINRTTSGRFSLIDAGRNYDDNESKGSAVTSSVKMSSGQQGQSDDTIVLQDYPKCLLDGFMEMEFLHDNPGILNSPINSSACSVDLISDDVGECEIPWEDLVIGERIGFGSFGEVYLADMNGTEVAAKKFLDQDSLGAAIDDFKSEVRIMRRLRHPNVVLFMGAVTRPPNLSIITEYLPRGSLYHLIHHPHCQIDEKRRLRMALDVARGMNSLHTSSPPVVHRDLKSPNLLVDNNWNVKVCDFGLSRLKHHTFLSSKSTAGTPEWMAPEVLRNEPSNEKCDIFSFGVILWELASLKLPWSGVNPMQVVGEVGFKNKRLEIPKDVDPLVARIIWECWQTDPALRPSFAQLCVALKPLQHLTIPASFADQQSPPMPWEISVNFSS